MARNTAHGGQRVWHAKGHGYIDISHMDDDHLHNTILLIARGLAEGWKKIGQNQDLAALLNELEEERVHRGLPLPLVPYKTLKHRKGDQ